MKKTKEEKRQSRLRASKKWYAKPGNKEKMKAHNALPENKSRRNNTAKLYLRALRQEMVKRYGGRCKCCGETIIEFLTIDHTNNDGAYDRKKNKGMIPTRLKRFGWPKKGFQLLCYNCNCAKGAWGKCPHKNKKIKVV